MQSVLTRVCRLVSFLVRPGDLNLGGFLLFSLFSPLEHAVLHHGANGFVLFGADI